MSVPKVKINLDEKIENRYLELIDLFDIKTISKEFLQIYNSLKPNIPSFDNLISGLVNLHKDKIMFFDEIKYWSDVFEIEFHKVLIMQLIYELNSACTTFVVPIDGINTMFRTMDWSMDFLKSITYQAIFYKNNVPVYEAVCWLGSIGVFTGKSLIHDYSLAINYRRVNDISIFQIYKNYLNSVNMHWPVSYLTRYLLENSFTIEQVLHNLINASTISPVYYILNNFKSEPIIIRRTPNSNEIISNNIIIQTNCDEEGIEPNIMNSHKRLRMLKKILKKEYTYDKIINTINEFPITNEDTIYLSIINKDIFDTKIISYP